jgi:DNA-binding LytR/AlgR family response regulator
MRNGLALSNEYPAFKDKNPTEPDSLPRPKAHKPLTLAFRQSTDVQPPSPGSEPHAEWQSKRIAIKANGKIMLIDPAEIVAVEAQGNYVLLRQKNGSLMIREQISVLAGKLHAYGLIRIHRSVLVNAVHVEDVASLSTGEHLLRMKEGRQYHVTRTYKNNLQLLAPTWIGA